MFESKDGAYYLFDIKTAKPNAGGFKEFKRTLLEWVAVVLAKQTRCEHKYFYSNSIQSPTSQNHILAGQCEECSTLKMSLK